MPEKTPTSKIDGDKTFTQAELDKIVSERVGRERAKFSDYDDLKAKADKAEELENEKKSSDEKLAGQIKSLTDDLAKERQRALIAEVAREKKLTAAQARRLNGTTREELETDADDLLEAFGSKGGEEGGDGSETGDGGDGKTKTATTTGRPTETLRSGAVPGAKPEETDPRKLAEQIPRQ